MKNTIEIGFILVNVPVNVTYINLLRWLNLRVIFEHSKTDGIGMNLLENTNDMLKTTIRQFVSIVAMLIPKVLDERNKLFQGLNVRINTFIYLMNALFQRNLVLFLAQAVLLTNGLKDGA